MHESVAGLDSSQLGELRPLAEAADPDALMTLGFMHEHGIGTHRDVQKAIESYRAACRADGHGGCASAAYFYQFGVGVPKDEVEAARYVEMMDLSGIEDTDELERQRRIVYKAKAEAETDAEMRLPIIEYLERHVGSASASDRAMMDQIGFSQLQTLRLAAVWADRDADPELLFLVGSFYNLGYSHSSGKDVEALSWWSRAAQKGEPRAQNLLGLAYAEGRWGAELNSQLAISWFERGAEKGEKDAFVNLGEIYYLGESVPVDYPKALALFERAEEEGASRANTFLSWMHYNGQAGSVDCQKALEYRRAYRPHRSNPQGDQDFKAQCVRDRARRDVEGLTLPILSVRHSSTFHGSSSGSHACEPHFVVKTDRLAEVANLRIVIALTTEKGETAVETLAFRPFGLNTMSEDVDGQENDPFSSDALLRMKTKALCDASLDFSVRSASARINGQEIDVLAHGLLSN